jgi:DNA topoisomerase-3
MVDDPGVKKQLDIIKALFDEATEIIVATDAGREGELIFRYIYYYLKCKKPFKRYGSPHKLMQPSKRVSVT